MPRLIEVENAKTTGFKYSDEFFAFLKQRISHYIEMTGEVHNAESTVDYANTKEDWSKNGCRIYTANGYMKFCDIRFVIMDVPDEWLHCHGIDEIEELFYDNL